MHRRREGPPKPRPMCSPPTTATRGRYQRGAVRPPRSVVLPSASIVRPGNVGGRRPPPAERCITATASGSAAAQRRLQLEEVGRVGVHPPRTPPARRHAIAAPRAAPSVAGENPPLAPPPVRHPRPAAVPAGGRRL